MSLIKETGIDISTQLKRYKDKQLSAQDAITGFINPGDRIFIGSGCSEPCDLTKMLITFGSELQDVEMIHLISLSDFDYYKTARGRADLFRHNVFFISDNLRSAVGKGSADYTPMLLSDIPRF